VVIDGPPVLAGTAGAALAAFAGQVVLVVAAGQTSQEAIDASLRRRASGRRSASCSNRGRSPTVARTGRFARTTAG
jgi:alkanesulfonate monooxygenase SsuD/methylene tetrahydromethanopterin reductase-like flavin-dependent oxidoreductase (luciferase family)